MTQGSPRPGDAATRWAAVSFLAYAVLHHLGAWPAGGGQVGGTGTRWADWADLAIPSGFGLRHRSRLGGLLLVAVGSALATFAVAVPVSAVW